MGIGGSAFNNGVKFISDNYTAKFVMKKDNSYDITTGTRVSVKPRVIELIKKIPVIKGFYEMFFGGNRIIPVLIATNFFIDISGDRIEESSHEIQTALLIVFAVISVALLFYIIKKMLYKIKDSWRYHGAEHKTILAYEDGLELSLENVRKCPRKAKRCGTNLVVFIILFYAVFSFFIDYASVRLVLSWVLAYELFDLEKGDKIPVINIFFKIGYWCQQKLFTLEPSDIQIIASIETINKLIELENNTRV